MSPPILVPLSSKKWTGIWPWPGLGLGEQDTTVREKRGRGIVQGVSLSVNRRQNRAGGPSSRNAVVYRSWIDSACKRAEDHDGASARSTCGPISFVSVRW